MRNSFKKELKDIPQATSLPVLMSNKGILYSLTCACKIRKVGTKYEISFTDGTDVSVTESTYDNYIKQYINIINQ